MSVSKFVFPRDLYSLVFLKQIWKALNAMVGGEISHEAVSIDDGGKEFTGIELANHLNNYFM